MACFDTCRAFSPFERFLTLHNGNTGRGQSTASHIYVKQRDRSKAGAIKAEEKRKRQLEASDSDSETPKDLTPRKKVRRQLVGHFGMF
jgi:hypothetical protein